MSSQLSSQHHLGLVFFDVLFVDGHSLLSTPYSRRRELLESLITPLSGQVILAKRFSIDLREGLAEASNSLAKIYANVIADHHEGLVIKAGDSKYNQWNKKWIKLKKVCHLLDVLLQYRNVALGLYSWVWRHTGPGCPWRFLGQATWSRLAWSDSCIKYRWQSYTAQYHLLL